MKCGNVDRLTVRPELSLHPGGPELELRQVSALWKSSRNYGINWRPRLIHESSPDQGRQSSGAGEEAVGSSGKAAFLVSSASAMVVFTSLSRDLCIMSDCHLTLIELRLIDNYCLMI